MMNAWEKTKLIRMQNILTNCNRVHSEEEEVNSVKQFIWNGVAKVRRSGHEQLDKEVVTDVSVDLMMMMSNNGYGVMMRPYPSPETEEVQIQTYK